MSDMVSPQSKSKQDSPPWASFAFWPQARYWFQKAVDLLYPPVCVHCGRVGEIVCRYCDQQVEIGMHIALDILRDKTFEDFYAIGPHHGVIRSAIHALKYENEPDAGHYLGQLLGQKLEYENLIIDMVIPVPLHPTRLQERGYNQAKIIAESVANIIGGELVDNVLVRRRYTQSQVELSAEERRLNVEDAFELDEAMASKLFGKTILLIDDVCTTGSTLKACAEALQKAQVQTIYAATVSYAIGS